MGVLLTRMPGDVEIMGASPLICHCRYGVVAGGAEAS